mmetsp:Transcript_6844/g.12882  ORF Transcript_6844/g.12882 Transcript_6844/m.12882 type:complete len:786 (-) Transcript_6844:102-2459(-)
MSSSSSFRPTYTKSRTTKNKTPRLHGAFRGGFSAGYFNTVGSKHGWKPGDDDQEGQERGGNDNNGHEYGPSLHNVDSSINAVQHSTLRTRNRAKIKTQTVQDFMDDEDANDWGGPVSVRKDYHDDHFPEKQQIGGHSNNMISSTNIHSADALKEIISGDIKVETNKLSLSLSSSSLSIGKQLLRVLGWRETDNRNINNGNNGDDGTCYIYVPDEDGDAQSLFPYRNIKRIERKLSKHKKTLPKPKIDTHGLGYDAFRNAPEFQAHKDIRNKRAHARARAAASIHGDLKQNVYRTSVLHGLVQDEEEDEDNGFGIVKRRFGDTSADRKGHKVNPSGKSSLGDDILAYETTEDFIGQKTVGGFALHDDDDDVYDDNVVVEKFSTRQNTRIDTEEYENEIVEASDSDVDADGYADGYTKQCKIENYIKRQSLPKHNVLSFAGALSSWASGTEPETKVSSLTTGSSTGTKSYIGVTSDGKQPLKGFVLGNSSIGYQAIMKRFPGPDVPFNYVATRHVFQIAHTVEMMKQFSSYSRRKTIHNDEKVDLSHVRASIKSDLKPLASDSFIALSESLKERFRKTSDEAKGSAEKESHSLPIDPTKVTIIRKQQVWQPCPLLCKRMQVSVPRVPPFPINHDHGDKNEKSTEESFFHKEIFGKIKKENSIQEDVERPTLEIMKSIFEPLSNDDDDMSISDDEDDGQDAPSTIEVDKPQEPIREDQYPSSGGMASNKNSHSQVVPQQNQMPLSLDMKSHTVRTTIPDTYFRAEDQYRERIVSDRKSKKHERKRERR